MRERKEAVQARADGKLEEHIDSIKFTKRVLQKDLENGCVLRDFEGKFGCPKSVKQKYEAVRNLSEI